MDQLTALNVFKRVVEFQSFSAAARDMGLSNAAVSKNVAELETHLGVRLLTRTTRRLSVTEAGEKYYKRCVGILDDLEGAAIEAAGLASAPSGNLVVTAPLSFGLSHLSPAVPHYLKKFPEVNVELDLNVSAAELVTKEFDVAVRASRNLNDSSLISRKLAPMTLVLCGTPAYFKKQGTPKRPEDLLDHHCVINSQYSASREWRFTHPSGDSNISVSGRFKANGSIALKDVLLEDIGVGLVPRFMVHSELEQGFLVSILDDWGTDALAIYATFHHRQYVPAKVRSFVDFMADWFGKHPDFRS